MTNKVYYNSKNPISCIAFANWCIKVADIPSNTDVDKWYHYDDNEFYTTTEMYYIWEALDVDKPLPANE